MEGNRKNINAFFESIKNNSDKIVVINYKIVAPAATINIFSRRGDVSEKTKKVDTNFKDLLKEYGFDNHDKRIHKKLQSDELKKFKKMLIGIELWDNSQSAHIPRLWALTLRITKNTLEKNIKPFLGTSFNIHYSALRLC